jgi:competence protein ComEC
MMDAIDDPDLGDDNDGSMFVRLEGRGLSAVFTGDASAEAEERMLRKGGNWAAHILKAGHHGSRFSSCDAWLAAVNPSVAIISCGRNNVYGHPSPDTLARIERHGIGIHRTDREGTLTFDLTTDVPRLVSQ